MGVLHRHMSFIEREGYGTTRCYPSADWHYMPIFCGWAEQTSQAEQYKVSGNSMATQANYEAWIRIAEERGLPLGTIIIDDKWAKGIRHLCRGRRQMAGYEGLCGSTACQGKTRVALGTGILYGGRAGVVVRTG